MSTSPICDTKTPGLKLVEHVQADMAELLTHLGEGLAVVELTRSSVVMPQSCPSFHLEV